jgi:hypothetical protein
MVEKMILEKESVVLEGIEYHRSNGNWYNSQNNVQVPLCVAIKLDNNFGPSKMSRSIEGRKTNPVVQAGLPGLGKRR